MTKKSGSRVPEELDLAVGQKLTSLRNERKLSQADVGNKIGVSFQQVQKYERGMNRVSSARLQQLAKLFEVPISHFYEAENYDSQEMMSVVRDLDSETINMLLQQNF